jgi:hypothetical protein
MNCDEDLDGAEMLPVHLSGSLFISVSLLAPMMAEERA